MTTGPANDGDADDGEVGGGAPPPPQPLKSDVVAVWQALATRRIAYDTLMWQTPALGLTAQAFLLTLALGGEISDLGRAVAAGLAAALAINTVQLMAKHRHHEVRDSKLLERIEENHQFADSLGFQPHPYVPRAQVTGLTPSAARQRFRQASSFRLWTLGQLAFLAVAVLVLVLVITGNAGVLDAR